MTIKKILASAIAVILAFSVVLPAVADTETPAVITEETATPTDAARSSDASTPTDAATPEEASTPADASTETEPETPASTSTDAATSTEPEAPAQESTGTDAATSTEPETPASTSTDAATSTEPSKPDDTATKTDPSKPDEPDTPVTPVNPPASGDYDFEEDERLRSATAADYNAGNFAWGSLAPAMYGIMSKEVYTIDNIPKKVNEITGKEEPAIVDSTNVDDPANEGILLTAFYTFKCPKCGNAVGDTSIYNIYKAGQGKCTHCGEMLPNPDTVKIYRMIIVDPNSPHKKTMKGYDFTKVAKEVYGPTAELYGDGKDLPEQYMIFTERQIEGTEDTYTVYSDFYTKGIHGDFKDGFMARLMLFIVRFTVWLTPRSQKFDESGINDLIWKIRVKLFETLEGILTKLVSGKD